MRLTCVRLTADIEVPGPKLFSGDRPQAADLSLYAHYKVVVAKELCQVRPKKKRCSKAELLDVYGA